MLYVIAGMALLFLVIGLILSENNARYLLSGYNTLSAAEQKKVDIKSYVASFRKFHIVFAISFLVIGSALSFFVSELAGGFFLGIYPIMAYIYFIATSRKYFRDTTAGKWQSVCIVILIVTLIFVLALFIPGARESRLLITNHNITLTGIYGEEMTSSDLEQIELVDHLPVIVTRSNGFALGDIRKGYFRTADGGTVKLILNGSQSSYLLLTKSDQSKIYYSSGTESNEHLYNGLRSQLSKAVFKNPN